MFLLHRLGLTLLVKPGATFALCGLEALQKHIGATGGFLTSCRHASFHVKYLSSHGWPKGMPVR